MDTTSQSDSPAHLRDALHVGLSLLKQFLEQSTGSAPNADLRAPQVAQAVVEALQPSLLRLPDVIRRVGIGESYWLKLVKAGEAPAPIKIGAATLWDSRAITSFIERRIEASKRPAP